MFVVVVVFLLQVDYIYSGSIVMGWVIRAYYSHSTIP